MPLHMNKLTRTNIELGKRLNQNGANVEVSQDETRLLHTEQPFFFLSSLLTNMLDTYDATPECISLF